MPLTIVIMTPAEIARVFDWYSTDLPQNATFQQEIYRWSTVRSIKILKTNHPPYPMLSFDGPGLLPKHSRNLPHSTNSCQ